jgi:dsRNA-specific ribonuclease
MAAKSEYVIDHTENWKMFFPSRNERDPILSVNRNFDKETLKYASKGYVADNITNQIVKRMIGRKFFIIECCAGIGGNTLSFLNHPMIYGVKSYEKNEMRRLWLKRNIMAYDLGSKAIVPDIPDHGLTGDEDFSEFKEAVFYFDPPWLPEGHKMGKDYKDHYITKDMKVGKKTLEQWLVKNKDVASMMIFRVPPGCVIEEVPGWTYEVENLKNNGLCYYCYNNVIYGSNNGTKTTRKTIKSGEDLKIKPMPFKNEGGFGSLLPVYESCKNMPPMGAEKEPRCKVFLKWGFVDPDPPASMVDVGISEKQLQKEEAEEPSLDDLSFDKDNTGAFRPTGKDREILINIFKDLKKPKADMESAEWQAEFQDYIYTLLTKIWTKDDSVCKRMVEFDVMPLWVKAFTHETVDANVLNNYENYEKLGDAFVAAAFNLHVYNYFDGNIDETALTNYKNQYMAKIYQADLSRFMKLGDWIRLTSIETRGHNIYEDAFESFNGALHMVGDRVRPGFGYVLVRKLIDLLFGNIKLDPRFGRQDPKTVVMQMFQGLGYHTHFDEVALGDGRTVKIVLWNDLYKVLQGYFPQLKSEVISEAKGTSAKDATNAAWFKALQTLELVGMTKAAVDEIKSESKLDRLEAMNPILVKLVKSKYTKEGFLKIKFEIPRSASSETSYTAILIGIKMIQKPGSKESMEQRETLATGSGKDEISAKLNAMQNYKNQI